MLAASCRQLPLQRASLHAATAQCCTRLARGWRWSSGGGGGAPPGGSGSGATPGRGSLLQPAAKAAGARDDLLKGVDPEHREAVARIVEQAQRAADSWETAYSDFHPPPVIADALAVLQRMADVGGVPWGGYPQAERCRLAVGREEAVQALAADPSHAGGVAAVEAKGNFIFDTATHRDFLGACLGTGVDRSRVGDIIIVGEQGAQILCTPNLAEHLEGALTQVRSVPVQTRPISLSELQVREPKVQEVNSIEASMRLDAVASAGFRISRGKMADLIKGGDVRVNWRPCTKSSADVKAGDLISVAGKGRLEVQTVDMTGKGKYRVQMRRFV